MSELKFAYLIMAHHRPDILKELVKALDYDSNDIYIHIDKKSLEKYDWSITTHRAGLFFITSIDIIWGSYSQVECEFRLLEAAFKGGNYDYYHLMTGVTYPIKSYDYINNFFKKNSGYEFIGYDNKADFSSRIKYKYLMTNHGKRTGKIGLLMNKIEKTYIWAQKIFGRDLSKKYGLICKKGLAYFSITDRLVNYILGKEEMIRELLRYSISGDEIFVQTLAYNSEFREKIYDLNDEYNGCLRLMPWNNTLPNRNEHCFELEDLNLLQNSSSLFALKFDGKDGMPLIEKLKGGLNQ